MAEKTIEFKTPGRKRNPDTAADQFVAKGEGTSSEPSKRLTIDVAESLHRRIKAQCPMRGSKMADVIRARLEKEFQEGG